MRRNTLLCSVATLLLAAGATLWFVRRRDEGPARAVAESVAAVGTAPETRPAATGAAPGLSGPPEAAGGPAPADLRREATPSGSAAEPRPVDPGQLVHATERLAAGLLSGGAGADEVLDVAARAFDQLDWDARFQLQDGATIVPFRASAGIAGRLVIHPEEEGNSSADLVLEGAPVPGSTAAAHAGGSETTIRFGLSPTAIQGLSAVVETTFPDDPGLPGKLVGLGRFATGGSYQTDGATAHWRPLTLAYEIDAQGRPQQHARAGEIEARAPFAFADDERAARLAARLTAPPK